MALAVLRLYTPSGLFWVRRQNEWRLWLLEVVFCICLFFCARFDHINVIQHNLDYFLPNLLWSFHQNVVLGRRVLLTISTFYLLEHKTKSKITFAAHLSFSNTVSRFWLKICASNIYVAKLKTLCFRFPISKSSMEVLASPLSVCLIAKIFEEFFG